MVAHPERHRAEPHEPFGEMFATENAVLDMIEHAVRTGIALGLALQMRARLEQFSELMPAPCGCRNGGQQSAANGDVRLLAISGAAILHALAKTRRTDAGRKQLDAIASLLTTVATVGVQK